MEEHEEALRKLAMTATKDFQSGIIVVVLPDGNTLGTAFGDGHYVSSCALTALKMVMERPKEGES